MSFSNVRAGCVVALFAGLSCALADTNVQITLSQNGQLSWTNSDPNLHYTVEWRSSLSSGNWSGAYRSLQDIRSTNSVITTPVPMFFRLVGSTNAMHTIVPSPGSAALAEGFYTATNLSAVDPDLSETNIRQGITVFGIDGALVPSDGTATPADVAAGKTFFGFGQTNWTLQVGMAGTYTCAPGQFDLNGLAYDECEFQIDPQGIYVSANDPSADDGAGCGLGPVGTGVGNRPCLSITRGLQRAVETGRTNVHVANGVYNESITLVNGVNFKGGYDLADWSRNVANTMTVLRGNNAGQHKKAVTGINISQPLTIEGFVFFGQPADQAGGNSYVVYLRQCTALVKLQSNLIFAASGANGGTGAPGIPGTDGQAGSNGSNAVSVAACTPRSGKTGGLGSCGSINGGAAGGNVCTFSYNARSSGQNGVAGQGTGAGTGGLAGYDLRLDTGGICVLPTSGSPDGGTGGDGVAGANGSAGTGGTFSSGSISGNEWVGASGNTGGIGLNGAGGGGGGAGGGAQNNGGGTTFGGGGGSGGAGGCGGGTGSGGGGGGGSIGVFVSGGVAPSIQQTVFYLGRGGNGGTGGAGGQPGKGGTGGTGGSAAVFCSGQGGKGGNGGQGGWGGGGGGGAGGVSHGILVSSASGVPNYSLSNTFNSGTAGAAGVGGLSFGNSGSPGVAGAVQIVSIR